MKITDDELLTILRPAVVEAMGEPYAARMHDSPWEKGALAALRKVAVMTVEAHDKWEECLKEIDRQKEHIAGLQAALRSSNAEQS